MHKSRCKQISTWTLEFRAGMKRSRSLTLLMENVLIGAISVVVCFLQSRLLSRDRVDPIPCSGCVSKPVIQDKGWMNTGKVGEHLETCALLKCLWLRITGLLRSYHSDPPKSNNGHLTQPNSEQDSCEISLHRLIISPHVHLSGLLMQREPVIALPLKLSLCAAPPATLFFFPFIPQIARSCVLLFKD